MKNYPEQIEKHLLELTRLNQLIETTRAQISTIEAELQLEIITARTIDGKLVFSNDTARSAAFTKSCDESDELQSLIAERRTHEYRRAELLAKVERLRLEFKLHELDRLRELHAFELGIAI